jgi:vancomycin resistance protein VanJ
MLSRTAAWSVLAAATACGPAPLQPRDPTPGVPHFLVQTYNIQDTGKGDPVTVETIGEASADIICLQEPTAIWEKAIRARYADEYPTMLFRTDEGAGGLAVLSRFPVEDLGYHTDPHGWHPAWHLQVETPMGTVQLLAVHLRSVLSGESSKLKAYLTTGSDHVQELQAFTEKCTPGLPTLVMGDFNEQPDGPSVAYLEGRGFQNALPLYHPGQPTWHDPPAWQVEETIDHILFNHSFAPLNSWVVQGGHSDHMAVVAHFEAAPP